jgi:hypothetical protein
MRWLRTLLLGLMIGPASLTVDAADADAAEAERVPSGHAIRGANFYVWDEDARVASAWAKELAGSGSNAKPAEGTDIGAFLSELSPFERTWLISSWATSANEPTRRMLARALSAPVVDGVGVRWALEHLQRDPSAEVRRLAGAAEEAS